MAFTGVGDISKAKLAWFLQRAEERGMAECVNKNFGIDFTEVLVSMPDTEAMEFELI